MALSRQRLIVALLVFVNIINYADRILVSAILPEIMEYFSIDNAQAGLIQTVYLLSLMVSSIAYGVLGDCCDKIYICVAGIIIWSSGQLLGSFVPSNNFYLFYFSRVLLGFGQSGLSNLGVPIISDYYEGKKRTQLNGYFLAAIPLGSGLGYFFSPQITYITGDWRWSLRITPIICIIICICIFIMIPIPGPKLGIDRTPKISMNSDSISVISSDMIIPEPNVWKRFLKYSIEMVIYFSSKKLFILNTLAYVFFVFAFGGFSFWMPKYLISVNNVSESLPGRIQQEHLIFLIFGSEVVFAGFVGVLIPLFLISRFKAFKGLTETVICIFSCMIGSVFSFVSLLVSLKNMWFMWVFMIVGLIGSSVIFLPQAELMMIVIDPNYRARAASIECVLIHGLGDAISPFIIGYIVDRFSTCDTKLCKVHDLRSTLYMCPLAYCVGAIIYCISTYFHLSSSNSKVRRVIVE